MSKCNVVFKWYYNTLLTVPIFYVKIEVTTNHWDIVPCIRQHVSTAAQRSVMIVNNFWHELYTPVPLVGNFSGELKHGVKKEKFNQVIKLSLWLLMKPSTYDNFVWYCYQNNIHNSAHGQFRTSWKESFGSLKQGVWGLCTPEAVQLCSYLFVKHKVLPT